MDDFEYIVETGVIIPDTSEILTNVQNEYKSAFGQDLVVSPETPQGMLITAEALARDSVVRNNAALANQINPNLAGGIFLDAIWALTGGQRIVATRSSVFATIAGVPSTVIPAFTRAATPDGDEFETVSTVIIQPNGSVIAEFRSVEYGPIPAAANTLTQIIDAILGWETVDNADAAILGRETESDSASRSRRRNTLALQGQSQAEAITSGLYNTEGVRSLTFRENVADTSETIDGVLMVPHSIYVCVDGGTDQDVASMILEKKSSGSNWNGDQEVDVFEPFSGQLLTVKFDRPDPIPVLARVTIKANTSILDPQAAIKEAILAFANGEIDGEDGFTVGATVSPFELAGAINKLYPSIFVLKVEVSYSSPISYTTDILPIQIFEIATIISGSISVVIA
jgi:uncharacterized phage protein gp47/JayE